MPVPRTCEQCGEGFESLSRSAIGPVSVAVGRWTTAVIPRSVLRYAPDAETRFAALGCANGNERGGQRRRRVTSGCTVGTGGTGGLVPRSARSRRGALLGRQRVVEELPRLPATSACARCPACFGGRVAQERAGVLRRVWNGQPWWIGVLPGMRSSTTKGTGSGCDADDCGGDSHVGLPRSDPGEESQRVAVGRARHRRASDHRCRGRRRRVFFLVEQERG